MASIKDVLNLVYPLRRVFKIRGGKGSGYHGPHEGLPGVWGGSRPRAGGKAAPTPSTKPTPEKITEADPKTMSKNAIEAIAKEAAENVFNELGKSQMSQRRRELEGLGVRISQWTRWAGEEIMVIAYAALTDANWHSEAEPLYEATLHVAADNSWPKPEEQPDNPLTRIAQEASENVFNELGKSTMTKRRRELEGLGTRISQWSDWDGDELMVVFYAALEDANWHTEAGRLYEASKNVAAKSLSGILNFMKINRQFRSFETRGGKGSGYHGPDHLGLPGVHGGSKPRGGGAAAGGVQEMKKGKKGAAAIPIEEVRFPTGQKPGGPPALPDDLTKINTEQWEAAQSYLTENYTIEEMEKWKRNIDEKYKEMTKGMSQDELFEAGLGGPVANLEIQSRLLRNAIGNKFEAGEGALETDQWADLPENISEMTTEQSNRVINWMVDNYSLEQLDKRTADAYKRMTQEKDLDERENRQSEFQMWMAASSQKGIREGAPTERPLPEAERAPAEDWSDLPEDLTQLSSQQAGRITDWMASNMTPEQIEATRRELYTKMHQTEDDTERTQYEVQSLLLSQAQNKIKEGIQEAPAPEAPAAPAGPPAETAAPPVGAQETQPEPPPQPAFVSPTTAAGVPTEVPPGGWREMIRPGGQFHESLPDDLWNMTHEHREVLAKAFFNMDEGELQRDMEMIHDRMKQIRMGPITGQDAAVQMAAISSLMGAVLDFKDQQRLAEKWEIEKGYKYPYLKYAMSDLAMAIVNPWNPYRYQYTTEQAETSLAFSRLFDEYLKEIGEAPDLSAGLAGIKSLIFLVEKGGKGSGYHGPDHKGLSGVWGGSQPREGGEGEREEIEHPKVNLKDIDVLLHSSGSTFMKRWTDLMLSLGTENPERFSKRIKRGDELLREFGRQHGIELDNKHLKEELSVGDYVLYINGGGWGNYFGRIESIRKMLTKSDAVHSNGPYYFQMNLEAATEMGSGVTGLTTYPFAIWHSKDDKLYKFEVK